MTDPIALTTTAQPAEAAGLNAPRPTQQPAFDPVETRMFARMMQGVQLPPPSIGGPNSLNDAARAVVSQLSGHNQSIEDMRRSMLESIDLRDPIRTMVSMTDHSMQAHAVFTKLHIATGLASAATSLFGGLLKNQN